jgi:hypothetical protein
MGGDRSPSNPAPCGMRARRKLADGGNEMKLRPGPIEERTVVRSLFFLMLPNHDQHLITALCSFSFLKVKILSS